MNSSWHADAGTPQPKSINKQNPLLAAFRYKQSSRPQSSLVKSPASNGLFNEISTFSDSLRTSIVPQFDELEVRLQDSLTGFQKQLESFDAIQTKTHNVVAMFKEQVSSTQSDLEGHLERLNEWTEKDRNIEELESRLTAARQKLAVFKDRLESVLANMRESEKSDRRNTRLRLFGNMFLSIFIAAVALSWYYLTR